MTRRLSNPSDAERLDFLYNGETVQAVAGDTIASALLAAGMDIFSRSIKYHRPRGAFCLAGRCSHCLVRADGISDVLACTTPVKAGMKVAAQNSYPSAKHDVLAAIDWMFPKGLDHHSMFAGVPVVEGAVARVARHIAGLAPVPEQAGGLEAKVERSRCAVAVVGAGPSGLACAHELRARGAEVVVVEDRPWVGGRLAAELDADPAADLPWAERTAAALRESGVRLLLGATALAVYRDEGPRTLVVRLRDPDRLLVLQAGALVFCNGAVEPIEPFEDNDLPGVYAGRGLARLVRRQRVLPGTQAAIVGAGPEALALARLLQASGAKVAAVVDAGGALRSSEFRVLSGARPQRALGRSTVKGLEVVDAAGSVQKIECDLIALCGKPAAGIELPREAGAFIAWRSDASGYFVETAEGGRTAAEGVYACGDVTGSGSAAAAREAGAALGRALAAQRS